VCVCVRESVCTCVCTSCWLSNVNHCMGWLRSVGSIELQFSFAEYRLFTGLFCKRHFQNHMSLLQNIVPLQGSFAKDTFKIMSLLQNIVPLQGTFAKDTYNFIDPTNRRHPIQRYGVCIVYCVYNLDMHHALS